MYVRPPGGWEPVEVRIPLANLARELWEQLPRAEVYQDLPRGRKTPDGDENLSGSRGQRHVICRGLPNQRLPR
jgi:hypothetical protein